MKSLCSVDDPSPHLSPIRGEGLCHTSPFLNIRRDRVLKNVLIDVVVGKKLYLCSFFRYR